jgi:hypothetical protein
MANAPKLTSRELAETWQYQKVRDLLDPAWDGDSWEGLTRRQQVAFAKSEQAKKNAALEYLAKVMPRSKKR